MRVETTELGACPICGSRSIRSWRRHSRDRLHRLVDQEFDHSRCRRCGVRFLAQMPLDAELGKLYPDDYGPYAPSVPQRPTKRLPETWSRKLLGMVLLDRLDRELESFYSPDRAGATLLDYGCGSPAFLDAARERGWQTAGADFSPAVVEQVRAGGHAGFLVGQELDEAVADATLARVRLNHVLEHLNDPRPALSQIRRKIAPGGRIHIATPNPAGIGSVLFRTRWFSLDCPRHLLLYPPRLVSDLLQDSGFRHTRVIHQVVSKDIVRSWRYLVHDLKRIRHDEIEVAVPDEAGSAVMRLPGKLAALLSISDRFHVFADA